MSKIDTETNTFECMLCWHWEDLSKLSEDSDYCNDCYNDLKELDRQRQFGYYEITNDWN